MLSSGQPKKSIVRLRDNNIKRIVQIQISNRKGISI